MKTASSRHLEFTFSGFLSRWGVSLFIVFASYNPAGYSYYHWVARTEMVDGYLSLKIAAGVLLATSYLVMARISRSAVGTIGFITALVAAALFSYGVISLTSPGTRWAEVARYMHLVSLATALAVGVSWAQMKHRLIGQRTARTVT